MDRRQMLKSAAALPLLTPAAVLGLPATELAGTPQSLCRWCYGGIPLEKLAAAAKEIGYSSIELLGTPAEVKTVKDAGLTCAVYGRVDIVNGWNRKANHAKLIEQTKKNLEVAAEMGLPSVIVMSGNRTIKGDTVSDEEGLVTCTAGLKEVLPLAEAKKVSIVMEGLNSKVNHQDYMYDKTAWGVKLCQALGSDRFKLLYDIYHMQIMEGDVIATIRKHKDHIGHYHTGGVPGRNEIDDTQELNYPAIVQAIRATGYTGYLGQEFIPKKDPLTSAAAAYKICGG